MTENFDMSASHHEDESSESRIDYLKRAAAANEAGDALLSMYLYLAAFEEAVSGGTPKEDTITGLKQAWALACANKERSLAEYIFELMEPYLSAEEISLCADELQNLALDKLEEFGLSREELENMANMISEDLLNGIDDPVIRVEHFMAPTVPIGLRVNGNDVRKSSAESTKANKQIAKSSESTVIDGNATAPSGVVSGSKCEDNGLGAGAEEKTPASNDDAAQSLDPVAESGVNALPAANDSKTSGALETPAEFLEKAEADLGGLFGGEEIMNYDTICGYDSTVATMRDFGIGMGDDASFREFVDMLNAKHGLTQMPALDTIVFRSPAREDANRFMMATLGELSLPTVHMRMEENYQGMPILCVSAHAIDIPKNNSLRDVFINGGVLVLEDLDLWSSPAADLGDDNNAFLMMQLTRGAREAVNLIRSAVENPDVYVIVTTSTKGAVDGFFLDMLEPMTIIDIDFPTPEERVQIWMDISQTHPSMRDINKAELVRLSANMPRFDIYMAAREAVEEAYKIGLVNRAYQPVTRDNIFDKLAAYQPLESEEYTELEDAVIDDFRADLKHIDDLLKEE